MEYLRINPDDNVAVAIKDMRAGESVAIDNAYFNLITDIPAGHKFALSNLSLHDNVIKYGFPIGHAIKEISRGELVNEKNIKTNLEGKLEYEYAPHLCKIAANECQTTFKGYRRASGEVGIRNEIWIIPTVGCVNGTANTLAEMFRRESELKNIDAVVAYPHNYGCSQLGEDHENTRKILRDMVQHPNAGGVLIVGLGCENNQVSAFKEMLGEIDDSRIKFIETQKVDDEYEIGMQMLRQIYDSASKDKREDISIKELRLGLKCGGSDGFSGITANPLMGVFSDFIVQCGGTTILTEVPEMFGAETILMNRCKDKNTFNRTVALINDFKDYFLKNDQPVYENPSPGNKAGGISTLEEKSLGCTQKCGNSQVRDVLQYGEKIKTNGLNLLSAPGNDLVASTALAACGCHMVLFTTGRGTPFGTFVPTLKISTNSALYNKKRGWIDFNAGTLIENETMEEAKRRFIEYIIKIASGEKVNNEKKNYREIAIFKTGVTL